MIQRQLARTVNQLHTKTRILAPPQIGKRRSKIFEGHSIAAMLGRMMITRL